MSFPINNGDFHSYISLPESIFPWFFNGIFIDSFLAHQLLLRGCLGDFLCDLNDLIFEIIYEPTTSGFGVYGCLSGILTILFGRWGSGFGVYSSLHYYTIDSWWMVAACSSHPPNSPRIDGILLGKLEESLHKLQRSENIWRLCHPDPTYPLAI